LYNQGSYSSRKDGIIIGSRIALMGINVKSWDYFEEGELILPPKYS
jgi:hypothetical protein